MQHRKSTSIGLRLSRSEGRAWIGAILTCALASSLSGCVSYWESNHRSWRMGDGGDPSSEPASLGSSTEAQSYEQSPFVTASDTPGSEFGRNMGVREYASDWTYAESPAVPHGFQTHHRVQRLSFAVGATTLDREAHGALMQVRDQLKANTRWHLLVIGMADKERESGMNPDRLSERRAQTVKDWLVRQGIDPERISSSAFGSRYAVGDQFQPMTMRSDRRVEVWAFM